MPENAICCVIEDDHDWQNRIHDILANSGHRVVLTATNYLEALAAIPQFSALGVQVVTVDGNLSHSEHSGDDGKFLAQRIRVTDPGIKIIGLSGVPFRGESDVDLTKWKARELGEVVRKL